MIHLVKTNPSNPDVALLIEALDKELSITDGDEHSFYNQFNGVEDIQHMILVYDNDVPVSMGALKHYNTTTVEIKRMFTVPTSRRKGLASIVLNELENWSKELNYCRCILETGTRQLSAIALYKENQYQIIKNYGQYHNKQNSICFEKIIG